MLYTPSFMKSGYCVLLCDVFFNDEEEESVITLRNPNNSRVASFGAQFKCIFLKAFNTHNVRVKRTRWCAALRATWSRLPLAIVMGYRLKNIKRKLWPRFTVTCWIITRRFD